MRALGKVGVYHFRAVAKACPSIIGQFDPSKDSLIFSIPTDPDDEFEGAVLEFANTTSAKLRTLIHLRTEEQRGRIKKKNPTP